MSASYLLNRPLSVAELIEQPEKEIKLLLEGSPRPDGIRRLMHKYMAYAVEVAECVGQVNSEIKRWKDETPAQLIHAARSQFRNLYKDRAGQRRVKELLEVYKESVRKLERAERRHPDNDKIQSACQEEGPGVLKQIVSAGLYGLFGKDQVEGQPAAVGRAVSRDLTQKADGVISEGSDVDAPLSSLQKSISEPPQQIRKVDSTRNQAIVMSKSNVKPAAVAISLAQNDSKLTKDGPIHKEITKPQISQSPGNDQSESLQSETYEESTVYSSQQESIATSDQEAVTSTNPVSGGKTMEYTESNQGETQPVEAPTEKGSGEYQSLNNPGPQYRVSTCWTDKQAERNRGGPLKEKTIEEKSEREPSDNGPTEQREMDQSTQDKDEDSTLQLAANLESAFSEEGMGRMFPGYSSAYFQMKLDKTINEQQQSNNQSPAEGKVESQVKNQTKGEDIVPSPMPVMAVNEHKNTTSLIGISSKAHDYNIQGDDFSEDKPFSNIRPKDIQQLEYENKQLMEQLNSLRMRFRTVETLYNESCEEAKRFRILCEQFKKENEKLSHNFNKSEFAVCKLQQALQQQMCKQGATYPQMLHTSRLCTAEDVIELEIQLKNAMEDKKLAMVHQKTIEKVLETTINEKDCLIAENIQMKLELNAFQHDKLLLEDELDSTRREVGCHIEKIKSLGKEIENIKCKLLSTQEELNQTVKENREMQCTLQGALTTKDIAENMNRSIKAEFDDHKLLVEQWKEQVDNMEQKLFEANQEVSRLKIEKDNLKQRVDTSVQSHVTAQAELEKECVRLEGMCKTLKAELKETQKCLRKEQLCQLIAKPESVSCQDKTPAPNPVQSELADMEEKVQSLCALSPGNNAECEHLKREILRLKKIIDLKLYFVDFGASASKSNALSKDIQDEVNSIQQECDWLRCELTRARSQILDLKTEIEERKAANPDLTAEILQRASESVEKTNVTLSKTTLTKSSKSISMSYSGIKEGARSVGIQNDRDKSQANLEKNEENDENSDAISATVSRQTNLDGADSQKNLVEDEREQMLLKLIDQNDALNLELLELQEKLDKIKQGERYVDYDEYQIMKEKAATADGEINFMKEQVTFYQKTMDDYLKSSQATAFLVKERESEIRELKERLADIEKKTLQNDSITNARRKQSKGKYNEANETDSKGEPPAKTDVFTLLAEEAKRIKAALDQEKEEKAKLLEMIQQRDNKVLELANEIKQLQKKLADTENTAPDQKPSGYANAIKKLRDGDAVMSKVQTHMEILTKQRTASGKQDQSRTYNAQLLSNLIANCLNQKSESCKIDEMVKICAELDGLEAKHFELNLQMHELLAFKYDILPRVKKELQEKKTECKSLEAKLEGAAREVQELIAKQGSFEEEKKELLVKYEIDLDKMRREMFGSREDLNILEKKAKVSKEQTEKELVRTRQELLASMALAEERQGAAMHWKLRSEDLSREIKDLKERYEFLLKEKASEMDKIKEVLQDIQNIVTKFPEDTAIIEIQKHIKEIQNKHIELINKTKATSKITERDIERFYHDIGEISVTIQKIAKERDLEVNRLNQVLIKMKEEKDMIADESAKILQDKQVEIRKLLLDFSKQEMEMARLHALHEENLNKMKIQFEHKIELLNAEQAHMNAIKDNDLAKTKSETERKAGLLLKNEKTVLEIKAKLKAAELSKAEFVQMKEAWNVERDKLNKELDERLAEKLHLEKMVERLNKEMESRLTRARQDSITVIDNKDSYIRDLFLSMYKIAKERGELSSDLAEKLQEKEKVIEELMEKLKLCDGVMDKADDEYKETMEKKSKEIKMLRNEIKKMGTEGVKLLDQREREINDMRIYLQNVLKAMEHRMGQVKETNFEGESQKPNNKESSETAAKEAFSARSLPARNNKQPVAAKGVVSNTSANPVQKRSQQKT